MLDGFLKYGSGFDWITPLLAFIQDARYGQPLQINVPYNAGYSFRELTGALQEKGVKTWGLMVVGDTITFTVRKPQARYALYWLGRWGVLYQAKVEKLSDGDDETCDESTNDIDETAEDYRETMYTAFDQTDDEMEDAYPYKEGLVDHSLRRINNAADRLFGSGR